MSSCYFNINTELKYVLVTNKLSFGDAPFSYMFETGLNSSAAMSVII